MVEIDPQTPLTGADGPVQLIEISTRPGRAAPASPCGPRLTAPEIGHGEENR
ncbi:MAG: hypothetical protein L0H84_02095 [Pseudonocardia sp.]|nr:hypothetical protein [Pseudonocardia sp.]